MALLMASAIGVLVAAGVYLMLRARTLSVLFGTTLISYAVNLFLLSSGRLGGAPPVLVEGRTVHTDPLPQALVLTAIVISFGMTAFLVVLSIRAHITLHTDHVDGREPVADPESRLVAPKARAATTRETEGAR
ncbi:MAG TPA: Na+/H+ antiporter subunit C [Gemmatimonadales bacterium]